MHVAMAIVAEHDEIVFAIGSHLAPVDDVVDLELITSAAVLASPIVSREGSMITTMIELVASPGNSGIVCNLLAGKLSPDLAQTSVADVYTGICRHEQRIIVLIVIWRSVEAAEEFELEVWPHLADALLPFLDTCPRVRTFATQSVSACDRASVISVLVPAQIDLRVA